MTFTYNIAQLDTPLAKVRLEVGDTDTDDQLFQDEEIQVKLAERADNVLLTAADLCDILAARFARDYDFAAPGDREFKRSQRSEMYAKRAESLRDRARNIDAAGGGMRVLDLYHGVYDPAPVDPPVLP